MVGRWVRGGVWECRVGEGAVGGVVLELWWLCGGGVVCIMVGGGGGGGKGWWGEGEFDYTARKK